MQPLKTELHTEKHSAPRFLNDCYIHLMVIDYINEASTITFPTTEVTMFFLRFKNGMLLTLNY